MRIFIQSFLVIFILFTLTACGSGAVASRSTSNNVVPLIVDGGYNGKALNTSFITVTLCQSGTKNCQAIDHILVDSGSTGFRVNQSILTLQNFTPITFQNNTLYQCTEFNTSFNTLAYDYGAVVYADVKIGSEVASNIPIQIIDDASQTNVPSSCSNGLPFASLSMYGAKGIIGINPISNPNNRYTSSVYSCDANSNCTQIQNPNVIPTQLNLNPVTAFPVDNNGAIFNLPAIESPTNNPVTGTLTFGLNTQSNNIVPADVNTVLGDPDFGMFISYSVEGESSIALFDSGNNTLLFKAQYAQCESSSVWNGSYCPNPSPQIWQSTISSYNGSNSLPISVPIVNYQSLSIQPYIVPFFGAVAGLGYTSYGLPFFFGKSIYLGFKGPTESGAQTPLGRGPAWGFKDK